ncbi:MAG: hypothetical protein IT203_07365 [Fimbriimonadaceae bacterium]|nr:hypothetical protein [Fimbriimonadaceae bacterium]
MVSLLCGLLALVSSAPVQKDEWPVVALPDGKLLRVTTFAMGTEREVDRLKSSDASLIILRTNGIGVATRNVVKSLQNGPKGRRIVMVDFPLLAASPKNLTYWRHDWDANDDGKPDEDAPSWLGNRNKQGVYPYQSSSTACRNVMLGPQGMIAKVVEAGFDGMVVTSLPIEKSRSGFDVKLVVDATIEGRKRRNGFSVILRDCVQYMDYPAIRNFLDGILVEGLYYGQDRPGAASNPKYTKDSERYVEWVQEKRRIVLTTAYTSDPKQIDDNRKKCKELGAPTFVMPNRD